MRYAIYFTPSIYDPLSVAAASWLGRNVYSGEAPQAPSIAGFSRQELAFHTAVPRRYGFHGTIKAPFRLHDETSEPALLKSLMHFASTMSPFEIPKMEIARLGEFFGLAPSSPCEQMSHLAASVVQAFDQFRAPLSDIEIERRDPDRLTAPQFFQSSPLGLPLCDGGIPLSHDVDGAGEFQSQCPLRDGIARFLRSRHRRAAENFQHCPVHRARARCTLARAFAASARQAVGASAGAECKSQRQYTRQRIAHRRIESGGRRPAAASKLLSVRYRTSSWQSGLQIWAQAVTILTSIFRLRMLPFRHIRRVI